MVDRDPEKPRTAERLDDFERRSRLLEKAVGDLAAAQRDFFEQLGQLAAAVEQLAHPSENDGAVDRPISLPKPSPSSGGLLSRVRRPLRFILRQTLGTLRRVWDAAHPRPPWGDQVRLRPGKPPGLRWPRLAVELRLGEGGSPGVEAALGKALERQTDRDVEVFVRDRDDGPPETEYVWCVSHGLADVPSTFIESVKLLLAAEDLAFVSIAPDGRLSSTQWIVSRELWHPEELLDVRALGRRAKRFPDRVLGKAVGSSGFLSEDLFGTEVRRRLRRSGPYFVPANAEPRIFEHRLAPPPDPSTPGAEPMGAVLVLLTIPLTGGLERTVAAILDTLAAEARCLVASTASQDEWSRSRFRRLEHLTPAVYGLGDFFAEESRVEVLAHLISRHGVDRILLVGEGTSASALQDALTTRSAGLPLVALPVPEPGRAESPANVPAADGYLAITRQVDSWLRNRHDVPAEKVWRLPWEEPSPPAPSPPAPLPGGEGSKRCRRELRLPADAVVVTMWSDLIPEKRPEDFAALAHRFRADDGFRFLLVGDGPSALTVRDLESYFGLRNFVLETPRRTLEEYLDVTDVFCTTAEQELVPYAVLAALDRGRPVVAAAVDDLEEILAAGPAGIVVPFAGDLDGFEAAIRSLAEDGLRRERGRQARRAVGERRDFGEICRRALRLERSSAGGGPR